MFASAFANHLYTHPDTPVDTLDTNQLRNIFSLRQRAWGNSQRITICLPDTNTQAVINFTKKYLGLFPYQLRRHWERATFSGKATAPDFFSRDEEIVQMLLSHPGAIGIVSDNVDTRGLKRVEILP